MNLLYQNENSKIYLFYPIFTSEFNFYTWVFLRKLTKFLHQQKNLS